MVELSKIEKMLSHISGVRYWFGESKVGHHLMDFLLEDDVWQSDERSLSQFFFQRILPVQVTSTSFLDSLKSCFEAPPFL
jgi:hypothetical protein